MSSTKPQTLKGYRDFLPKEKALRNYVEEKIKKTFEVYGFSEIETPTIEYASLLLGKYGDEPDKLVYQFEDNGGRKVALRYDQTVPAARILSSYKNELPNVFKRSQLQNVFRAEKPQAGRYRELRQCDIDTFGTSSALSDAEILACIYEALRSIKIDDIKIKINDRELLNKIINPFSSKSLSANSIIQSIDKLDKKSKSDIISELNKKGVSSKDTNKLFSEIEKASPTDKLKEIMDFAVELGVAKEDIVFDPTLARGLDYYTGMIFEVISPKYKGGSLAGGGRYDGLIKALSGHETPAVGGSIGFDRAVEFIKESEKIPQNYHGISILVTIFDKKYLSNSITIANYLRKAGFKTILYTDPNDKLAKQLKYADKIEADYSVIVGPDEILNQGVVLRDMNSKTQESVSVQALLTRIQ